MAEINKHTPGMLCWADLGTTDVAAAKKFYSELAGWAFVDDPMGPDAFYSRAQLGGRDVCAIYKQQAQEAAAGVPPHWSPYIAVDSADAIAAKAPGSGGRTLGPAFDVFESGRMALLQDPSGGVIGAWQAKSHIGARLFGQPGTLCWTELMTTDVDGCARFYTGVFGWQATAMPMANGTYTVFNVGGQPAAGMMATPDNMKGVPSHWMIYFATGHCDSTIARAQQLGGKALTPGIDIPGVGRFAALLDPQGAPFAVLQPA